MRKHTKIQKMLKKAAEAGCVPGLESMAALMDEFSNIQDTIQIVHIAGTNGKGSTSVMIQQIAKEAGYSVGRYSSPAVFQEEEKYQIDGKCISKEEYFSLLEEIQIACERMEKKGNGFPTLFEIETAAAFLWFYHQKCDLVVIETGMGGLLDATNIIRKPLCSVITSVSKDHMGFLGESLEEIAKHKAGIIKEGCPIITICQEFKTMKIIKEACEKAHGKFFLADTDKITKVRQEEEKLCFSYDRFSQVKLSMLGGYQPENAVCAIETIEVLKKKGFIITDENILKGLETAYLPGRFEMISRNPIVVIDGAHNEDAAKKMRKTLELGFTNKKIIYIIGILADKEYEKIVKTTVPLAEKVFTITPNNPRALSGEKLCETVKKYHKDSEFCQSIQLALEKAVSCCKNQKDSMILVFGTLSCLREVKKEVLNLWT